MKLQHGLQDDASSVILPAIAYLPVRRIKYNLISLAVRKDWKLLDFIATILS